MAKIQISINDNLLKKVDMLASENYVSRSSFLCMAANQYVNQAEMISSIMSISLSIKKIADNNLIDDDSLKKLEDFERIARLFVGK